MTTYRTITEHDIEYDAEASPEVARLIAKLARMLADTRATEDQMVDLAYAESNPLLERGIVPGRGMITRATLERPEWHVIDDLLTRKRIAEAGTDVAELAEEYTLTVSEAARDLGVHESAIRQAIASRRLVSWLKDGRHYLRPDSLESFALTLRRPARAVTAMGEPLTVQMGTSKGGGGGLHVKFEGKWVPKFPGSARAPGEGMLVHWTRAAVIWGRGEKQRLFELAPGDEEQEIEFEGLLVRGKFAIVTKENNPKRVVEKWKGWPEDRVRCYAIVRLVHGDRTLIATREKPSAEILAFPFLAPDLDEGPELTKHFKAHFFPLKVTFVNAGGEEETSKSGARDLDSAISYARTLLKLHKTVRILAADGTEIPAKHWNA